MLTFVSTLTGSVSLVVVTATPVSVMDTFAVEPVIRSDCSGVVPNQPVPRLPSGNKVNPSSATKLIVEPASVLYFLWCT